MKYYSMYFDHKKTMKQEVSIGCLFFKNKITAWCALSFIHKGDPLPLLRTAVWLTVSWCSGLMLGLSL